jgi:hypothetical protein
MQQVLSKQVEGRWQNKARQREQGYKRDQKVGLVERSVLPGSSFVGRVAIDKGSIAGSN